MGVVDTFGHYTLLKGQTMAHYCTHLCQQWTILYSITAEASGHVSGMVVFCLFVCLFLGCVLSISAFNPDLVSDKGIVAFPLDILIGHE